MDPIKKLPEGILDIEETDEVYEITWKHHGENLRQSFIQNFTQQRQIDLKIVTKNGHLTAHKIMLTAASPFLEEIIKLCPPAPSCPDFIAYLILHKIPYGVLQNLLHYIYQGTVIVQKQDLQEFINSAKELDIIALRNVNYKIKNDELVLTPKPIQRIEIYENPRRNPLGRKQYLSEICISRAVNYRNFLRRHSW